MRATPAAPRGLSPSSRRLWRETVEEYELEAHHLRLLEAACRAHDRMTQAQTILEAEGIVVDGRYGPRAHPAVSIERDARVAFARLIRELALDDDAAPDARPPRGGRGQ